MDGWAKYVCPWQSGVGIEGYYIACFDCNAPCCIAGHFKRMKPTCAIQTHKVHMNEAHANPPVNESSAVWHFEHGKVIKVCDETIFGFYMRLSHVVGESTKRK